MLFAGPEFPAARGHLAVVVPGIQMADLDRSGAGVAKGAEVLVPLMAPVDAALLDTVSGLRVVQQWGAGLEGVDIAAATERGIAVGNVTSLESGSADSVAEWCVMAALALSRRLGQLDPAMRAGSTWGAPIGRALTGKSAAIIGLGGLGRALAARLSAFSMELAAVTAHPQRSRSMLPGLREVYGPAALAGVLRTSDFVFLCLPLTPETRGIIGAPELQLLREEACLVNAGRGALVDEEALVAALASGRRLTVALDVYWREPLEPDHALLGHPQVLATPHIAGITDDAYEAIALRFADLFHRLEGRLPLGHCVNWAEVAPRFYAERTA